MSEKARETAEKLQATSDLLAMWLYGEPDFKYLKALAEDYLRLCPVEINQTPPAASNGPQPASLDELLSEIKGIEPNTGIYWARDPDHTEGAVHFGESNDLKLLADRFKRLRDAAREARDSAYHICRELGSLDGYDNYGEKGIYQTLAKVLEEIDGRP